MAVGGVGEVEALLTSEAEAGVEAEAEAEGDSSHVARPGLEREQRELAGNLQRTTTKAHPHLKIKTAMAGKGKISVILKIKTMVQINRKITLLLC